MGRSVDIPATDETVSAAVAGDEPAFGALAERHRRELHVHCYRMLASFDEAEDAVQETFLKAWRGRDRLRRRLAVPGLAVPDRHQRLPGHAAAQLAADRRGLVCRGAVAAALPGRAARRGRAERRRARRGRRLTGDDLAGVPGRPAGPAAAAARRADRPRRARLAGQRDRRGPARPASPRPTAPCSGPAPPWRRTCPARRAEWTAREPSAAERELVEQFIAAHERLDAEAALAIAARDIRVTMPPLPYVHAGQAALGPLLAGRGRDGRMAARPGRGQPDAGRGELPAPPGR